MVKKIFVSLLLFSILFISCAKKRDGIPIRVAYWGSPDEVKIIKETISRWEKEHPGIAVYLQHAKGGGDYVRKIITQIAGGDAPDIVFAEVNVFVPMYEKGVFYDLTEFIKNDKDFNIKEYFKPVVDRFTRDGKIYCIPRDTAPFAAVFYNKNHFDEAGIPYPKDNWNFNDLLKTAQKLTKKDENGFITQYGFYTWCWMNFVYGYGGKIVDDVANPTKCLLDSKDALAGLKFYIDLCHEYKVTPSPAALRQNDSGAADMFKQQKISMFGSGIWETPAFRREIVDFDWDVVMFPRGPKKRAFGSGGSGYCITKTTKHPKEAWEVLKALAGDYGQMELAKTGLAQPANKRLAQGKAWAKDPQKPLNKGMLNEAVKYSIYEPFSPKWQEAEDKFVRYSRDQLFDKDMTIEEFKTKVVPDINKLLFEGK